MFRRKIDLSSFVFEVTKKCNHSCRYCYNVWKAPDSAYLCGPELSLLQIKEIIGKLRSETKIRYLALSGGEPLLRDDIIEIIDFCTYLGIKANLLTNGALLTERQCREAIRAGVAIFEVPLVACDPKIHDNLTGADDLAVVIEGMRMIKRQGGTLIIVLVVTKGNIHLFKETLEQAIALDADGIMLNRFNAGGAGIRYRSELMPTMGELREALTIFNELVGYYGIKGAVSVPIPKCLIDPGDFPELRFGHCPSGNQKSYFTIDPYGNVRVCNHSPTIIGNLLEQSFRDILAHPFITAFQRAFPPSCADCSELHNCWGGCKAAAQVCTGDLTQADPIFTADA